MEQTNVYKILVIEDEDSIRELVKLNLQLADFEVLEAADGLEGWNKVLQEKPDLVLLDLMLPKIDGYELLPKIIEQKIPVIVLTAMNGLKDKIKGFNLGTDDYITKPFNILEVKARIKAIIRRTKKKEPEKQPSRVVEKGDLHLDCDSRRLYIGGKEINLTAKEFDLLELMALNPNKVYSRDHLLNAVWGYDYPGDVRTVDVHIRRLREKIESNPSEPKYVHTKWGVGYYFNA